MYDYAYILNLIDRSNRLQEELGRSIDRLHSGGANTNVNLILDRLIEHYQSHHPAPMIVETDLSGVITYVNNEFARVSKYTPDELIGENINILRSSTMERGVFTDIWNNITEGRPWRGRLQNRNKNYETYWIDTLIMPVLDDEGEVVKFWSLSFEITEIVRNQEEAENKSKMVAESLKYAKRIQMTILPSNKILDEYFDDYFILYKPKDVVSGDFYWFAKTIDRVFIAAVDCTGHGVPGAFMSLIGYNLLNTIVLRQNILDPGKVLSELHRQVRHALKQDQDGSKSKDGMDVALLSIELYQNKFHYAGAFRPLFYVKEGEFQTIDGDKMSIGGEQLEEERNFTTHSFEYQPGDLVYIFSDGIVDQFGGPDNKKFSTKRLRTIITENLSEKMSVQRALFNLAWKDWLNDGEQTDDVTMIGIRLTGASE